MKVQVISNASDTHHAQFIGKVAIVIDVIRTSTTIISALEAGASSIVPVETIMEANTIKQEHDLLGGERFCKRISGFHLGNSPLEYRSDIVKGRRIILTTTNGTSAILRSTRAAELYVAGLVNAAACIDLARQSGKDIVILCAGSHDQFAIEDGFCAGYMIARLKEKLPAEQLKLDDLGYAMLALYKHNKSSMKELALKCLSGKRLAELGMQEELAVCMEIDTLPVVPRYSKGELVIAHRTLTENN